MHLAKVQKWIRRHDSWKSHLVQEKPSVRNSNVKMMCSDFFGGFAGYSVCLTCFSKCPMSFLFLI